MIADFTAMETTHRHVKRVERPQNEEGKPSGDVVLRNRAEEKMVFNFEQIKL